MWQFTSQFTTYHAGGTRPTASKWMDSPSYIRIGLLSLTFSLAMFSESAQGIPPLGLTHLDPDLGPLTKASGVTVMHDTVYVSAQRGVWTISSDGEINSTSFSHPTLTAGVSSVTPVIKGVDDAQYVGVTFRSFDNPFGATSGAALYRLDQPAEPLVTWHPSDLRTPLLSGVDGTLRVVGTMSTLDAEVQSDVPAEFFMDGTFKELDLGVPLPGRVLSGAVARVSESGFAVGYGSPPGTIGIEGALWSPEGELMYVGINLFSVRDRYDGAGINIGMNFEPQLKYGSLPVIRFHGESGDISTIGSQSRVIVSQSDFAVYNAEGTGVFAYYPGLVDDDPLAALPIEDVFPELATINFDFVTDLYATTDGHIFMTLSGEDGLYLFGARDPSVIPEPATWVLLVLTAVAVGLRVCWRGRG